MGASAGASAITSAKTRISVAIPTLNGGSRFLELLEALSSQDLPGGCELVVIDSGSRDGTPEAAADAGAYVDKIPKARFNHGATRNLAISRTRGEIIALLTQDALPIGRSYLTDLVRPFEKERIDGVYARQFPRPDCDPILAERLRQWSAARDQAELHVLAPGNPQRSKEMFLALPAIERYLSSAFDNVASAVRRTTWEAIPFPARNFGEDVAWARNVLLEGGEIAFEPAASVEHSHRIEMVREFKRIYCDHKNLYDLFALFNVPSWSAVRRGWSWQRRTYKELLLGLHLKRRERLFWRLYSMPYALLETAAQFLGARSNWKVDESPFWRRFDERVRAGV